MAEKPSTDSSNAVTASSSINGSTPDLTICPVDAMEGSPLPHVHGSDFPHFSPRRNFGRGCALVALEQWFGGRSRVAMA